MFELTGEEIILNCPRCPQFKDPKLYVNPEKGVFNCFRCGYSGPIWVLSKQFPKIYAEIEDSVSLSVYTRLRNNSAKYERPVVDASVLSDLKSIQQITEEDPQYTYLLGRGWSDDIIALYRPLKSSSPKFKDRVIIPVYFDNKIVYFTARDITGKAEQRYINPIKEKDFIFTSKTPVDSIYNKDAFICEGVFDSFKIPGCCSLLGKTLNKTQHKPLYNFLKSRDNIYICLDPGTKKDSIKLASEIDSWFMDKNIFIMNWVNDPSITIDLGDISKKYNYRQILKFIKSESSPY